MSNRKPLRTYPTIEDFQRGEGYDDAAIAREIGKSRSFVSMVRRGQRTPSLEVALAISRFCRVPLETLVKPANKERVA